MLPFDGGCKFCFVRGGACGGAAAVARAGDADVPPTVLRWVLLPSLQVLLRCIVASCMSVLVATMNPMVSG